MSIIYINPYRFVAAGVTYDTDAQAYITAVEAADGQALETGVRDAINAFVVGCKADGIWAAIKASCIMAGARTLAGALVPLVGAAPTNFNFASGNYNRKTGLAGNGTTRYLDSNRNHSQDPQNSKHVLVYAAQAQTNSGVLIGTQTSQNLPGDCYIYTQTTPPLTAARLNSTGTAAPIQVSINNLSGSLGSNRSSNSGFVALLKGTIYTSSADSSQPPVDEKLLIFRGGSLYSNARLSFYSIGESLDLALLNARVTTLMNAYGAIP